MAKKRPAVSLAQPIKPRTGDLEKLFTTAEDVEQAAGLQLLAIRLDAIYPDPYQPRRTFHDGSLQELSESIRQDGVIQPIEVTQTGPEQYMIVHGERRWRAAQLAGLESIPAVVRRRDYDTITRFVRQMVENIQREDLNDVDRAAGLVRLKELMQEELDVELAEGTVEGRPHATKMTWAKVGKRMGMTRQRIHQLIQLLTLPEEIKNAVREGQLTERDTRVYQGLRIPQQRDLHQARVRGDLTPTEVRRVAHHLKERPDQPVAEAVREVRHPAVITDEDQEPVFGSSFEPGARKTRPEPPPMPAGVESRWLEQGSRPRSNAQNINRIHWARDHLSRMRLQGLAPADRQELAGLLLGLQEYVAGLVDTLHGPAGPEQEHEP
ncbi:MAG: ParB/RepB/Spo0J family partition protein [Chloroflexi bacterium]|nr:ParB/RepB/Spo0J family partition protein [Chloroflexota bacterium]MCI0576028.1 ParB/RepB/Spo0J family partition protein [Chloroflexota bacterium]MCI0645152.1 ParB/RepB/Spo0J family partition protein [Chloroflexota bacterium]MCI0725632.1 ParB/RepB/Spo0J family partition protein [Chloroflexota bacterium]